MITFLNIKQIIIEEKNLHKAYEFLRYAGSKRLEGIALFAGQDDGSVFHVREVIIPHQTSMVLEHGLMYAVDAVELYDIGVWLFKNKMKLIAQIHSHPQAAFHSEADDRFPIVDTYGGVSIVVPNFASGILNISEWAVFRLSINKEWAQLDVAVVLNLIKVR